MTGRIELAPVLHWRPSPQKATPTSARGRATSDRIRSAAVRVLERMDLAEATVLDIAREAGVASGTVYRYFVDKHDIVMSLLGEVEEELIRYTQTELPRRSSGGLNIREGFLAYVDIYRSYAPLFGAWVNIMRPDTAPAESWNASRHYFINRVAGALRHAQREGSVRSDIDPDLVAELLMAVSERSNYVRVVFGWGNADDSEIASALVVLFGDGLERRH